MHIVLACKLFVLACPSNTYLLYNTNVAHIDRSLSMATVCNRLMGVGKCFANGLSRKPLSTVHNVA
jgi:hypothetical protein